VAFATGLVIFDNMVMPRLVHRVGEVRVPNLGNLTLEQAERAVQPLGLKVSRAGERFDAAAPRGSILDQDPLPDTPVRGKKLVSVTVSLGEESSSVPALNGESLRGARALLERAGLAVGGITRVPSDELAAGLVLGSDPPAESVLPRGAAVSLLLSSGSGEESFVMPELLGREIGAARRHLEALGFVVDTPPDAPAVGTILFQNPGAGSRITRSTRIALQATGRIIR
jgi:serine/threonine-protein kinase